MLGALRPEDELLRRQPLNFDACSFLSGPGEMAARIREHDWTDHPLGQPETWPAALRSALGIALNSAFPTCIYWGSELRLLYNDSWSLIPGPRHPSCLGKPAAEVWSDIWHVIEPQLTQVISTGEGLNVHDQLLPMRRFGIEEETYWNYNFTPIRLEDGSIGGIFNSGSETTGIVLQQRNTRFLLELSDLFRGVRDVELARARPLEMLGRHLGADRVGLRQRTSERGELPVVELWTAPAVPTIPGEVGGSTLAAGLWRQLLDGHVIRLDGTDAKRRDMESEILDFLNCGSAFAVPWVEEGETRAILFVHSLRKRQWVDLEIQTAESVLERMMGWIERTRATERERVLSREIDHRARNLLSVISAIVRLAQPEEPKVMQAKLIDRIAALAKTHSLLADQRWEPVALSRIIEQELAPYADSDAVAIEVAGPVVVLAPDHSQSIALILHELTTNAAKYGVLTEEGGKLEVHWAIAQKRHLRIEWIETRRGSIDGCTDFGEGFGSRLLRRVVRSQLQGELTYELTTAGLHCVIDMPLTR
jgi:two-component sensor histidine kinase